MINLCTIFKIPACSRYEDMNSGGNGEIGPPKILMGHITLTMPLLGKLCIDRLGLLVVNVYTKFEVSHFIC